MIVLSNGGIEYPPHNFGIAVEQAVNEIEMTGGITPLGQRQQFLIGSELRERYVEESRTLLFDYYVPQTFLQTPQKQASILSLQAQMMGLFPASNVNDLTEWQQGNAVPPMQGVDFTQW